MIYSCGQRYYQTKRRINMALRSLIPVGRERRPQPAPLSSGFVSLQREIDRLFDEFTRGFPDFAFMSPAGLPIADITPRMNVSESDKAIELTVELPGWRRVTSRLT